MTYEQGGMQWVRSIEGYEPPRFGEVAVHYDYLDYTDYLDARSFNADKIGDELYGGEYRAPSIHYHDSPAHPLTDR